MTSNERQGWLVVASLFASLFLLFGSGYNTAGIFIDPLTRHFGWSRSQVSLLQTVLALSAGCAVPFVGWLLDKFEARVVIVAGAVLTGCGFLMASAASAFALMAAAYGVVGVGIAAATLLPASLVISNWFDEKRSLAMGAAMSGTSIGGMVMTFIASRVILDWNWRLAYIVLAVPMFLVVVPLVVLFVRTRPPSERKADAVDTIHDLEGLEIREAVRGRSFWLIVGAQFFLTSAAAATNLHSVPYLTGLGYTPGHAALALSVVLGIAAAGKLIMGFFADRIGARQALILASVLAASGLAVLQFASKPEMLATFVILYGLSYAVPLVLLPVILAEAVGLRRLGSLLGLTGIFTTLGGAMGPVLVGRIFDVTGSYVGAFNLLAVAFLLGAAAVMGCSALVIDESKPVLSSASGS